ncbi:hypothetical protein BB560_002499 [Smittium megazygosporum]|uniref:Small ribosomal subunit protein uS10m n=1 Tax=Smittium megazygosporum TaxID=133381 RepID=A0A2T9ZEK5_9FUNG|nr:hypothetical protein BB560_002499 [Smittium megazygosporum]
MLPFAARAFPKRLTNLQTVRSTPAFAKIRNNQLQNIQRANVSYINLLTKSLGNETFAEEELIPLERVDEVYGPPKVLSPTHNILACELKFMSYSLDKIDFYADFVRKAAYSMNIPCSETIHLPMKIKKWNALKSPFVHKSAIEIFERRTYTRMLKVYDVNIDTLNKLLEYVELNTPYGLGMKSRVFEYMPLSIGKSIKISEEEQKRLEELESKLPPTREKVVLMANKISEVLSKDPKANIETVTEQVVNELHRKIEKSDKPPEKK